MIFGTLETYSYEQARKILSHVEDKVLIDAYKILDITCDKMAEIEPNGIVSEFMDYYSMVYGLEIIERYIALKS